MRDYRDAKAMAQTLRQSLNAQSINVSHSNALELIAKTLGFKDWQVLAAKIEADQVVAAKPADPGSPSRRHHFCIVRFAARASTRSVNSSPVRPSSSATNA